MFANTNDLNQLLGYFTAREDVMISSLEEDVNYLNEKWILKCTQQE